MKKQKKDDKTFVRNGKTYRRKFYAGDKGLVWFTGVFLFVMAPVANKTFEMPIAGWILVIAGIILGICTFRQCWYDDQVLPGDVLGGEGIDPAGVQRVKDEAESNTARMMGTRVGQSVTLKTPDGL